MKVFGRKTLALLLCALLLLVSILSLADLAEHEEHECPGEGCAICTCLELSRSVLRLLAGALAAYLVMSSRLQLFGKASRIERLCFGGFHTPVLLRVRMNY